MDTPNEAITKMNVCHPEEASSLATPSSVSITPGPRIRWDEDALARHKKDRGVRYGTMKIDEPETPFLVYDRETTDEHDDDAMVGEYVPTKEPGSDKVKMKLNMVSIQDLQERLQVLSVKQEAGVNIVQPTEQGVNPAATKAFARKREMLQKEESSVMRKGKALTSTTDTCDHTPPGTQSDSFVTTADTSVSVVPSGKGL